jgi:type VI protein secretion system component VasF
VLNQQARLGLRLDVRRVQGELEDAFAGMRRQSSGGAGLAAEYERIELPLMFFVDNIICTSTMNIADDWERLAFKRNENNGDRDFFRKLDVAFDEGNLEQLSVYYTCLGLGFRGEWTVDEGGPEKLRALMLKLEDRLQRLDTFPEHLEQGRLTGDAYKNVRKDMLTTPPVEPITKIVIALVGVIIVLGIMNAYVYKSESDLLVKKLQQAASADAPRPDVPHPDAAR